MKLFKKLGKWKSNKVKDGYVHKIYETSSLSQKQWVFKFTPLFSAAHVIFEK
jgi:hypothetical protein